MRLIIAPATEADLDAIDEIERLSFPAPWPRETFDGELAREWARIDVGRVDGRIVAFNNYWIVTTELHVLAIATHPDRRGRGFGAQLLAHVIAAAVATGCSLATLEVRRSNVAGDRAVRARRLQDRARARALLPGRRRGRARHAARLALRAVDRRAMQRYMTPPTGTRRRRRRPRREVDRAARGARDDHAAEREHVPVRVPGAAAAALREIRLDAELAIRRQRDLRRERHEAVLLDADRRTSPARAA